MLCHPPPPSPGRGQQDRSGCESKASPSDHPCPVQAKAEHNPHGSTARQAGMGLDYHTAMLRSDMALLREADPTAPLWSSCCSLPKPAACCRLSSGSRAVSTARPSCSGISGYSTGTVSKASPANTHLPGNGRDSAAPGPAPATIPPLTGPGIVPPRSCRCRQQLGPTPAACPTYGASYGRGEGGRLYPSEESRSSRAVKRHLCEAAR